MSINSNEAAEENDMIRFRDAAKVSGVIWSQESAEDNEMVRRFERSEIILHWANAVPFLILFVTGALKVISRFVIIAPTYLSAFRTVHRITGALWIVSIGFSFFFIGRKLNIANLRDQFCLGLSDITWMITAFRSTYHPNIKTPPVGKFNTGQKINSVLVVLYAVAFAVSGCLMWVYNTMLFPWFFHASVYFMAVASVGGHLYLSFLHPSTRPGLTGIFNGMAPKSYILHHHSLMIEGAANAHQEITKTANGVFMKAEIVILAFVLIGGGLGVKTLGKLQRHHRFERGFSAIVNPGELSKAHGIKEIDGCNKCHEYSGELPDRKCLSCHKIIQARMEARLGNHGNLKDKCIHCHKEHPYDTGNMTGSIINFEKKTFDHAAAAFKLEGKHKVVKCEDCHKKKISEDGNNPAGYYVGLRYDTCLDCHKDVHKGGLGEKCETCHSSAGWKGKDLKFDHGSAKFRLEGKHAEVKCEKCHKPLTPDAALATAVFRGMKFDWCDECHKDPHRGELRAAGCTSCHSSQGWRGKDLKFDHGRDTRYTLEGKHESVKCAKCHKVKAENGLLDATSFKKKHESCSDCHKDPHRGELNAKCSTCHAVQGWRDKELKFEHSRDAKYALEGKHKDVKCVTCHKVHAENGLLDVASFRKKHEACSDCHKDPHRGEINTKCSACHVTQGWRGKDLKLDHGRDTKYTLEGKHQSVKCDKCHKAKTANGKLDVASFRAKHESCADCHKDPHRGELNAKCSTCHVTKGWQGKELKFDHNRDSKYLLQGKHKELRCSKCHKPQSEGASLITASFKIKHEICSNCHKDPHTKWTIRRGITCDNCHNFATWKKKDAGIVTQVSRVGTD